ncbi:MAG: caspase family protein [Bacteroidales bacterium]|nr:caspase family protein [Bacteroidales bacterium]
MKRMLTYLLLCVLCIPSYGGTKRALVVCVGDYPSESGWNTLASQNDKALVLDLLDRCGFPSSNVVCLTETEATYAAIVKALEELATVSRPGDQIYIHFSCHGQQITDQNGDEALRDPKDRYDEALIPYDASVAYNWNGYRGEHHLIDDTLNDYLARIRKAIGSQGTILLVADACHSGDISRENIDPSLPPFRGALDAFDQPYRGSTRKPVTQPSSWISISACKSFQTNFEVEIDGRRYGRLTYAISRCLKPGMSAGELVSALDACFRQLPMPLGKSQSPLFEMPDNLKKHILFDGR